MNQATGGSQTAAAIHRKDYQAPPYWIETVDLCFDLDPAKTRVLNKMRLRRNPDVPAQALRLGWLWTGDMARRDADGYLYIVDRSKDMIISGGFNVFPREIEDALSQHPAVAAAAVVGVPDAKWGEAVRALVVLRPGAAATAEELIAMVRDRKGSVYAPKAVDFVDALPMTGLGKLDKKAIRAKFWQGLERSVH